MLTYQLSGRQPLGLRQLRRRARLGIRAVVVSRPIERRVGPDHRFGMANKRDDGRGPRCVGQRAGMAQAAQRTTAGVGAVAALIARSCTSAVVADSGTLQRVGSDGSAGPTGDHRRKNLDRERDQYDRKELLKPSTHPRNLSGASYLKIAQISSGDGGRIFVTARIRFSVRPTGHRPRPVPVEGSCLYYVTSNPLSYNHSGHAPTKFRSFREMPEL
jgi:hypothetical protein